jgi:CRP-like cAMP-binding protein
MYEHFIKEIKEKVDFSDSELGIIMDHLTPKKIRRKQYLLQEGDTCKFFAFVEHGSLRSYTIDEKGVEHIIQFALEGWMISDLYSFLTAEPATYNIDALEDSELVIISKTSHEKLLASMWNYEKYIRMQVTNAYVAMQRRITSIISLTLEERYAAFHKLYPDIAQRVPQHMIASYMGLTAETLSRIRRRILRKS